MPVRPRLGCGIEGMLSMSGASADLVLCDLPSGETNADFDKQVELERFWAAVWHVLRPAGQVVLMASSFRFASILEWSQRRHFRYDQIWHKSIATGFLNASSRPLRVHEFILVFSREKRGTYNPQMLDGATPIHAARRRGHGENYGPMTQATQSRAGATDRFPVSVVEFASLGTSSGLRVHPQQKPYDLIRYLIRTYSNTGELVVDPTAGSGVVLEVAKDEGRQAVGWDLDPRFGK